MPQAIPAIVVSGIGYAAGYIAIETFVTTVIIAGLSAALNKAMAPDSQLTDAMRRGNRLNTTNNVEPIPVVYGTVDHVSGAVAWRASHSLCPTRGQDNTECLTTIVVWSEGEIGEITRLYFNDIASDDERFVYGTHFGGCISSQDARRVWLANYLGADDQAADDIAITVAAENAHLNDKWTADHRLRGIAYSRVLLRFEDGLYGPNAIPLITARLEGKNCYDWRTGRYPSSNNPAVILYDYLTSARYGCAFTAAEIDLDSFSEAANYCDQWVVLEGVPGARRRYTCNGSLSPTDSRLDNVKRILACCRGSLVYSGGLYRMKIDKPEVAAFDLNEDNLTGQWSVKLDSYGSRFNRVTARFINATKEWQPDLAVVDSEAYRAADQGEVLEAEIALPLVTSRAQALDIAGMVLRQSRYALTVEVNATLAAIRCEVGDVVTVTHETTGWAGKLFRVQGIVLQNNDEVRLALLEYNADVYDLEFANEDEEPPGTTLPDSRRVDPVTDLVLSPDYVVTGAGGRSLHIDVSWTPSESTGIYSYEIEWGPTDVTPGGAGWSAASITRADAASFVAPSLRPLTSYTVRVRVRNSIGAASAWVSGAATSLAAGNLAPINDVVATETSPGVGTLTWTPPADDRVTLVEIWGSVSPDFFSSTDFPTILATVAVSPSSYPITDFYHYWLRPRSATGTVGAHWSPTEWGPGASI